MPDYRVYIDESGDHAYRNVDSLDKRYLALTAILVRQDRYDSEVRAPLEQLKKKHFTYDPDFPPVLVRSQIIKRERDRSGLSVLPNGAMRGERRS